MLSVPGAAGPCSPGEQREPRRAKEPGGESGVRGRERGVHRRGEMGCFSRASSMGRAGSPISLSSGSECYNSWFPEVSVSVVNRKGKRAPPTQFPGGRMEGKHYLVWFVPTQTSFLPHLFEFTGAVSISEPPAPDSSLIPVKFST